MTENDKKLVARVDHDKCVGVGMCVMYVPNGFDFDADGQAVFQPGGNWTDVGLQEAVDACPSAAITLAAKGDEPWE